MQFLGLEQILKLFDLHGCKKIIVKKLAPNDNSKNQIYLGGHEAIQLLPSIKTTLTKQTSVKKKADEYIFRNVLDFYWLNNGGPHKASHSKMIYYPQYPETRFSGFLKGARQAGVSDLFNEKNKSRFPTRILFLSSNQNNESFGYVLVPKKSDLSLLKDISSPFRDNQAFLELHLNIMKGDTRIDLLKALRTIHLKGWIESCRLNKKGERVPYKAQNGGGYTLEAELGITPNGDAEPDYAGWEVKQHSHSSKVITLLTPEPDSGFYKEKGVESFLLKFGYPDKKGKVGRINFGGIYRNNSELNENTKLKLKVSGFKDGSFTNENGFIGLFNEKNIPVAKWTFSKLLEHWSRKHSKAVFVQSEKKEDCENIYYRYLRDIQLGIGTNFINFLNAVEAGLIYLDPALKLELDKKGKSKTKARNQFRVHTKDLERLYKSFEREKL